MAQLVPQLVDLGDVLDDHGGSRHQPFLKVADRKGGNQVSPFMILIDLGWRGHPDERVVEQQPAAVMAAEEAPIIHAGKLQLAPPRDLMAAEADSRIIQMRNSAVMIHNNGSHRHLINELLELVNFIHIIGRHAAELMLKLIMFKHAVDGVQRERRSKGAEQPSA